MQQLRLENRNKMQDDEIILLRLNDYIDNLSQVDKEVASLLSNIYPGTLRDMRKKHVLTQFIIQAMTNIIYLSKRERARSDKPEIFYDNEVKIQGQKINLPHGLMPY